MTRLAAILVVTLTLLWWLRLHPEAWVADAPEEPVQTDLYLEDLWMSLFERELA